MTDLQESQIKTKNHDAGYVWYNVGTLRPTHPDPHTHPHTHIHTQMRTQTHNTQPCDGLKTTCDGL